MGSFFNYHFPFTAAIVSNRHLKSLRGTLLLNDKDKYGLTAEVKINRQGRQVMYSPYFEITRSGETRKMVSGHLDLTMYRKADINLDIRTFSNDLWTMKGYYLTHFLLNAFWFILI